MKFSLGERSLYPKARFHTVVEAKVFDLIMPKIDGQDTISDGEQKVVDLVVVDFRITLLEVNVGDKFSVYQGSDKVGEGTIVEILTMTR